MKIVINEDKNLVDKIRSAIKEKGGYCPCVIGTSPESKCMCKDFIENTAAGEFCHCGLYKKVEE